MSRSVYEYREKTSYFETFAIRTYLGLCIYTLLVGRSVWAAYCSSVIQPELQQAAYYTLDPAPISPDFKEQKLDNGLIRKAHLAVAFLQKDNGQSRLTTTYRPLLEGIETVCGPVQVTEMDHLTKKTLTTKRGFTYTYYVSPAKENKATLLLQHGFPDSATEWEDLIISHLQPAGYGVVAVDQLGYAGTSKPTDPTAYRLSEIIDDFIDILDAEDLDKVISLGHDWGSRSAQMLYNLHPERVAGLVLVNVGYTGVTSAPFDLDEMIAKTEKAFGYGLGWYWKFLTADDGPRLLTENADVLFDALHSPDIWPEAFCTDGGVRKLIEGKGKGFNLRRRPYATEEMKKAFVERMTLDGFEGPTCWYKSFVLGLQDGVGNPDNNVVEVPTLFVGYTKDVVGRKEFILPSIQAGYLPQLTNITLDGAHWGLFDDPKVFGLTITDWLSKMF